MVRRLRPARLRSSSLCPCNLPNGPPTYRQTEPRRRLRRECGGDKGPVNGVAPPRFTIIFLQRGGYLGGREGGRRGSLSLLPFPLSSLSVPFFDRVCTSPPPPPPFLPSNPDSRAAGARGRPRFIRLCVQFTRNYHVLVINHYRDYRPTTRRDRCVVSASRNFNFDRPIARPLITLDNDCVTGINYDGRSLLDFSAVSARPRPTETPYNDSLPPSLSLSVSRTPRYLFLTLPS